MTCVEESKAADPGRAGAGAAGTPGVLGRLLLFVLLAGAVAAAACCTPLREWFSVEAVRRLAAELGAAGPALVLAAGIVTPLLFLPRWPIALVSGLLYGVVLGTLLSTAASAIGACLHFMLARGLLAPAAHRALARLGFRQGAMAPERTFGLVFLLRVFPLSSFVLTNLAAGALRVPFGAYAAATLLGMLPSSLMYAAWGKLMKQPSPRYYAIAAITSALAVGGVAVARRWVRPWIDRQRAGAQSSR